MMGQRTDASHAFALHSNINKVTGGVSVSGWVAASQQIAGFNISCLARRVV